MPNKPKASDPSSRTYTWQPLAKNSRPLDDMDGMSYLHTQITKPEAVIPVARTIGWKIVHAEPDLARLELRVEEYLMQGNHIMHGGVLSALIDSAMASAVISRLKQGAGCATLQMNLHYLRPVFEIGSIVQAEGRVLHFGRRTASTEATVCNEAGEICVTATSAYILFSPQ